MTPLPDLAGTAEAAEILGVEVPRVTRYRHAGRMPNPVAELAATVVWVREDVDALAVAMKAGEKDWAAPARRRLDLVGTAEAALMFGVDKSQIGRWRRAGSFPTPDATLAAGPLWRRGKVREWTPPARRRAKVTAA